MVGVRERFGRLVVGLVVGDVALGEVADWVPVGGLLAAVLFALPELQPAASKPAVTIVIETRCNRFTSATLGGNPGGEAEDTPPGGCLVAAYP